MYVMACVRLDPNKEETKNLFKEKEIYCCPEDTKEKTHTF